MLKVLRSCAVKELQQNSTNSVTALLAQFFSTSRDNSTGAATELQTWAAEWHLTPPVPCAEEGPPPTALQWLRRRGIPLPSSILHRLFRQRRVKLYEKTSGRVARITKNVILSEGDRLLLPKSAASLQQPPAQQSHSMDAAGRHAVDGSDARVVALAAELQRRVLHRDAELIILDKPAGLAVQGGPGVRLSLDRVMAGALRFNASEAPRLVHRLDRGTSGAMVLARTADAAAWLSAAFRRPAASSSAPRSTRGAAGHELRQFPACSKVYWAVVHTDKSLKDGGRISLPLSVGDRDAAGHGAQEAVTEYRVRGRHPDGYVWLEMYPITGRKHQLRKHASTALQAPILGDSKYGLVRSPPQHALLEALRSAGVGQVPSTMPLLLHCRQLTVQKAERSKAISAHAPLPEFMASVFDVFDWR